MPLKDAFSKLKDTIVGTTTTKIDVTLDKAVRDIISYKSNTSRNGYIDLVKNLISKTSDINIGGGLFNQNISPSVFGQGNRLQRYKMYSTIVENIPYAIRALSVLTDNILSPDDITKVSLEVAPFSYLEDQNTANSQVTRVKKIIKDLELEKKLHLIIKNTLENGDFFCEIADAKTVLTSRSILSEGNNVINNYDIKTDITNPDFNEKFEFKNENNNYSLIINYESFSDKEDNKPKEKTNKKKDQKKDDIDLKDVKLVFHEPNRVIKLQSSIFPLCFGYLIFPYTTVVPQITLQDQMVNNICISILNSLEKRIPQMKEFSNSQDLKDIIKDMIARADPSRAMNIRYVPPDKIIHFLVPSTKYYPYGESIFDASKYTAKVLIALETALAIQRLSRSTEKRKIGIEIGLPRDAKKAVEKMKEAFKKRKISLDSFGTIDTIPSQITTFEDIYVPQKDGKAFVDIDTMTGGNVDVRSKVDELKLLRDQLVACWGVPPSFIGIEENLCLKSNTYIPLINGDTLQLSEIIRQYENGVHDMYVYSYNQKMGKIVPGLVEWAGYTRKQTKLVRVHLDNGKYIDCTPDHPFYLRNGITEVEAQNLKEGDSLLPLYRKNTNSSMSSGITYEMVYHPGISKRNWELTYKMVGYNFKMKSGKGYVIHHKDYNPRNNHPENLESITNIQHHKIHSLDKVRHTPGGTLFIKDNCIICGKPFKRAHHINQITCSKKCRKERARLDGLKSWNRGAEKKKENSRKEFICPICGDIFKRPKCYYKQLKDINNMTCGKQSCQSKVMSKIHSKRYKDNWTTTTCTICNEEFSRTKTYKDQTIYPCCKKEECKNKIWFIRNKENKRVSKLNHKVVKVEWLDGFHDTGDLTIKDYHNFALDSGVIVHNSNKSALSEENILFARTIVNHQKYFTYQINELIEKVVNYCDPEQSLTLFDDINVSLLPPQSLQFERESRYINDIVNIIEALERIGVPKEYSKKHYLKQIDWKEVDKYKIDGDIDKNLGVNTDEEEGMGGIGGMGGVGTF